MKVLIAGSLHVENSETIRVAFEEACRQIGMALAEADHTIIVGSSERNTADWFAVEGAATIEGSHPVWAFRPDGGKIPFTEEQVSFQERIEFRHHRTRGPWAVGRVRQLLAADLAILIGGGRGTAQIGYSAPPLGVPVLAIPCFGGSAEEIWNYLERDYVRLLAHKEDFADMFEKWEASKAQLVLELANHIVKMNPYRKHQTKKCFLMFILVIVLLTAWIWLFIYPFSERLPVFFTILLISSILGTALRQSLHFIRNTAPSLSVSQRCLEAASGLLLAFGLSLIALLGGLTLTGDLEVFELNKLADFQRITLVFSLMGFAAGFLLETTARKLEKLVRSFVFDE